MTLPSLINITSKFPSRLLRTPATFVQPGEFSCARIDSASDAQVLTFIFELEPSNVDAFESLKDLFDLSLHPAIVSD